MNTLAALFCVFLFALTAPFTRMAALAVSPLTIIFIRILIAAVVCFLFVARDFRLPPKEARFGILATAAGTVLGFNGLLAFGLSRVPAGHAAVALAILPIATSVYSILRDRLKPGAKFWIFATLGALLSVGFFYFSNVKTLLLGDVLLLLSVLSAAFGYVEGGRTSRHFGGTRTMCYAVLATLPIILPIACWHFMRTSDVLSALGAREWFSLLYLGCVSQSLGMILWMKVLSKGPLEKIALLQQLQPFLTLIAATVLLGEAVRGPTWLVAALVAICVVALNREKMKTS